MSTTATNNTRIYITTQGGKQRLVRAASQAAARSFIARDLIEVRVPSVQEMYELAREGVEIENDDRGEPA